MSRLTRDDWARAALSAISTGGVGAVAVEALAADLGATKGSFYWHFTARDELLAAALERWEQTRTTAIIEQIEALDLAADQRLRALFTRVFDPDQDAGADVALLSHADDPVVGVVIRRVTARRIDYIADLLRQCGLDPRIARRRALFAYSAFLGHVQLVHISPDLVKASTGRLSRYADEVMASLLG
jgi:AcrR family transcriptional regulator